MKEYWNISKFTRNKGKVYFVLESDRTIFDARLMRIRFYWR
jgi:hypothetical protein